VGQHHLFNSQPAFLQPGECVIGLGAAGSHCDWILLRLALTMTLEQPL
jgi:hypothetical protein